MSVGVTPGLIKVAKIEDAGGVGQYLAVVQGANDGGCKKPTAANAVGFIGITHESQPTQNKGVPITLSGVERATVAGAVTCGDRLKIADNTGKLASCEASLTPDGTARTVRVVAEAQASAANSGDVIPVHIRRYDVYVPTA